MFRQFSELFLAQLGRLDDEGNVHSLEQEFSRNSFFAFFPPLFQLMEQGFVKDTFNVGLHVLTPFSFMAFTSSSTVYCPLSAGEHLRSAPPK